jgi:hypothetical protein
MFRGIAKLIAVLGLIYSVQCGTTTFSCIDDAIQRVEPAFNFLQYLLHFVLPCAVTAQIV